MREVELRGVRDDTNVRKMETFRFRMKTYLPTNITYGLLILLLLLFGT